MNKVKVKITGYPERYFKNPVTGAPYSEASCRIKLKNDLKLLVNMRSADKVGDEEWINHTMLGRLIEQRIPFEKILVVEDGLLKPKKGRLFP